MKQYYSRDKQIRKMENRHVSATSLSSGFTSDLNRIKNKTKREKIFLIDIITNLIINLMNSIQNR